MFAGGVRALLAINLLSFSVTPAVWLWRRKQLRKRKGKGICALGLVPSRFGELVAGKEPRAVRRETSFLLEEETWRLLRKAAGGWAAYTKGAAAQRKRLCSPSKMFGSRKVNPSLLLLLFMR